MTTKNLELELPMATQPAAWYALRRTLPTWSFDANLKELVEVLPRYGVDEIIVKVDTEEFTHGQPPLDWVKAYQPRLMEVRDAMADLGIVYSLNPWITVGHNDRGRDARQQLPGLRTMVGHDGTETTNCACPLCPVWRDHVDKVWSLYAETKPMVIWIEDDIRTFNHRPVNYGCFCELHLARFGERVGRHLTREEVVAEILASGVPSELRRAYLEMQAEVINETVAHLAKIVHRISPESSLGLMSSGPRTHCLEGRDWQGLATALADGRPLYSRPPMGNYCEGSLRGFYYSHDSIKITRHCLPPGVIEQTEVENVPFTRYSKSVVFTFLEMAISFAYGSHGVTMNLYDHAGTPMEDEAHFGTMLGNRKGYLNALAQRAAALGNYRGVRLLHHDGASLVKRLSPAAAYHQLTEDNDAVMTAFESHGIPTTYTDERVSIGTGQVLRAFSDSEIRELLRRGLFLDGTAAQLLVERGFGELIGADSVAAPVHLDELGPFSAEEFCHPGFGGAEKCYLTLTMPSLGGRPNVAVIRPAYGAEVISYLVDPDGKRHHVGMYAFENELGGRVVVHALETQSAVGTAFFHPHRRLQLQHAAGWLGRERSPIVVNGDGVYPLAFRKECESYTLVGFFNLSLDPWIGVRFDLGEMAMPARCERLDTEGIWRSVDPDLQITGDGLTLLWPEPVPFDEPLFLTFWRV